MHVWLGFSYNLKDGTLKWTSFSECHQHYRSSYNNPQTFYCYATGISYHTSLDLWIETPTVRLHGYSFYKWCFKQLFLNALPLNTVIRSRLFPAGLEWLGNSGLTEPILIHLAQGMNVTRVYYKTLPHINVFQIQFREVSSCLKRHNSNTVHDSFQYCTLNVEIPPSLSARLWSC